MLDIGLEERIKEILLYGGNYRNIFLVWLFPNLDQGKSPASMRQSSLHCLRELEEEEEVMGEVIESEWNPFFIFK